MVRLSGETGVSLQKNSLTERAILLRHRMAGQWRIENSSFGGGWLVALTGL
jgi:hypothetical protein